MDIVRTKYQLILISDRHVSLKYIFMDSTSGMVNYRNWAVEK